MKYTFPQYDPIRTKERSPEEIIKETYYNKELRNPLTVPFVLLSIKIAVVVIIGLIIRYYFF